MYMYVGRMVFLLHTSLFHCPIGQKPNSLIFWLRAMFLSFMIAGNLQGMGEQNKLCTSLFNSNGIRVTGLFSSGASNNCPFLSYDETVFEAWALVEVPMALQS